MASSSQTGPVYGSIGGDGGEGATTKLGSLRLTTDECHEKQRQKPTMHTHYNSSNVSEDTQRTAECGEDPRQDASTSSSRQQKSPEALACLQVCEALFRQKRIDECVRMLEQEYSMCSDPDALFLKAMCCLERNQRALCLGLLGQALAYHGTHVHSLTTYAEIQKDVGNFSAALEMIDRAHRIVVGQGGQSDEVEKTVKRAYAGILVEAGTSEKFQTGGNGSECRVSPWEKKYLEALEVCPEFAPAHYNLGVAASEAGDAVRALEHYRRATELHPEYVEALCNMGVILQHEGELEEAIEAYEKAYVCASSITSPESSEIADRVAKNLAVALSHRGTQIKMAGLGKYGGDGNGEGRAGEHSGGEGDEERMMQAISFYERAVAVSPCCAEALYNLGVAYGERGEVDKAIFAYRSAIKENPKCAEAYNNLGVLYRGKGLMGMAMHSYEAAVRAQPNFPQALNNLAVMYTQQGRASEALDLLQAAILVDPGYVEAWNNLGVLQRDVGEAEDAIDSYKRCVALGSLKDEKGHRNAGQNLLLGLNYIHDGNASVICDAHLEWGRVFQTSFPEMPAVPQGRAHPKIRVGYVSPDLFVHSVSYFAEAPIKSHNTDEFQVTVYSVCANPDAKTARLRREVQATGGIWKDVPELAEAQLAELVREDEIDILIDLTGHTANNRLGTFAMKPAPVQVTWIGYPNTTGLTTMDYRITDALCDPEDTSQIFSERLIRLDNCFLCYTPCPEAPEVAPLPADANGYITFGSFNALAKQTPEVLETWAEILKAVPGARLVLKNKPFASDAVRQKFWKIFEQLGVDRSRVDLLPLAPKTASHLRQYSMLDVCLDPFPYAGTTTTMEAMYMGVPCLTMRGEGHAHNVGVSLVTNVGLRGDAWIADDKRDYVNKAVRASNDVAGLRQVRRGLRARVAESTICNAKTFMNDLEKRLKAIICVYIRALALCDDGLELSVFLVGPSGATLVARDAGDADDLIVPEVVRAVQRCFDAPDVYSAPPAWACGFLQALCHVKKSITVREADDDLMGVTRHADRHNRIVSIVSSSGRTSSSSSASSASSSEYLPFMNGFFAAQRDNIMLDCCDLGSTESLFRQGCLLTSGFYLKPRQPGALLEYLMTAFVAGAPSREYLRYPAAGGVDFRASCFCHQKPIDVGYACSVCLSVFCAKSDSCSTCGSKFQL